MTDAYQPDLFAYQPDLFACPTEPQLPLARLHPLNARVYALDDCHEVQIALDRTHQLGLLFARVADGWKVAVSYYLPAQGQDGPVPVRSKVYPDFASAHHAAGCAAPAATGRRGGKGVAGSPRGQGGHG